MKYFTLIALTIIIISAVSCKKDYTCECHGKVTGELYYRGTISHSKKSTAKESCESTNLSTSYTNIVCGLK